MDGNRNRPNHLGINKISRNIHKSALHRPTFTNPSQPQQAEQQQQHNSHGGGGNLQPQVYNVNKSDFLGVVQQLTGTPTQENSSPPSHPPPANNPPKLPSVRLHKIRPPPLAPIARPPRPINPSPHPNFYARPEPPPAAPPTIPFRGNALESAVSAYMRYVENPHDKRRWLPTAGAAAVAAGRGPCPGDWLGRHFCRVASQPTCCSRQISLGKLWCGRGYFAPPCSRLVALPNLAVYPALSKCVPEPHVPRSPFPPLSPRSQYPPATPNLVSSSTGEQLGILGSGPQRPSSAGLLFPPSPTGFPPPTSPRWRNP